MYPSVRRTPVTKPQITRNFGKSCSTVNLTVNVFIYIYLHLVSMCTRIENNCNSWIGQDEMDRVP